MFMKLIKLCLLVFVIGAISVFGCKKDNEENLYGTQVCDTTAVKYSTDIVKIMNANCNSCHAKSIAKISGGGTVLDTYADVKNYADISGTLIGSVKQDGSASNMPKGAAKLSNCDINKIDRWILNGAPNN
jgi:uncharacterized membrane protein